MSPSMPSAEFLLGPIEILQIQLETDPLDAQLWGLVAEHTDSDTIRLLDAVVLRRERDGSLAIIEIDDGSQTAVSPPWSGLLADEDIAEIAADLAPGLSMIVVVAEHVWARAMAERLHALGGVVMHAERIPAPVVNEFVRELRLEDQLPERSI